MHPKTNIPFAVTHRPRRHFPWAPIFFLAATSLFGQTVRPLIDENVVGRAGKSASGKIEYVNDSTQTLTVTLEAKSFTVSDTGELSYRPLDASIHAKLSAMSFRILPKQNYFVFYEASADQLPSWFVVYATFGGFKERTEEGFRIQLQLPHTIYLLPKEELRKDDLMIKMAEYHPTEKKVVFRVENNGSSFGRVLEADVTSARERAAQGGFPVFPFSERQIEIPWEGPSSPARLLLRLAHFRLEQAVNDTAP